MHFRAVCHNVEHPMVCRVSGASGEVLVFLGKTLAASVQEVSGVIVPAHYAVLPDLSVIHLANSDELQEGDILLVRPSGGIRLLYRSDWRSNAIFLTNQCNNNCTCCPQPPKEDREDLLGIALQMVQLIREENPVLGITGGEPTCVWGNLVNIIGFTKTTLPGSYLHLLTNGRALADYDKAAQLAAVSQKDLLACVPLYADVHHIHDAITEVPGSFWETMAGLKNLARLSLPVEIRVVVTRRNYTRLPQMARFIYRNLPFVAHVAFMGLELVGYADRNKQILWVSPGAYMPYLEEALHELEQRDMHASIYNHPLCVVPEPLHRYLRDSISEWKIEFPETCAGCGRRDDCPGFFPSVARELAPELNPYNDMHQEAQSWLA